MTIMESKGSKQYRSVVIPYRPGRWLIVGASLMVLMTVVLMGVFWLGGRVTESNYRAVVDERDQLLSKLQATEGDLQKTRQQYTNISLGAEVDRQAVDEIRAVVREQRQTIAELNEEITFYKGLMAPTERERGLSIRGWEVYPSNDPTRFQFKLVVQQLALKHLLLTGYINVAIVGSQVEGAKSIQKTYSLKALSDEITEKNIKLRFKYFQNIEGELKLPEGFQPERINLVARVSKPKYVQIEKNYAWVVQG